MSKKSTSFTAFFLTLLLSFTDSAIVMGADGRESFLAETMSSMTINTSLQSSQSPIIKDVWTLFAKAGSGPYDDEWNKEFEQQINSIFNKENNLSVVFSTSLEGVFTFTNGQIDRIFDRLKRSNNISLIDLAIIFTKDIEDKISLQIFKGNLIPALSNLDDQHYINVKDIELSGSFTHSTTLRNLPVLETLKIYSNNVLVNLNLINLSRLKKVFVKRNYALTTLTLRDLPALKDLDIRTNNALVNLDVSGLPLLKRVRLWGNHALTTLKLQVLLALEDLEIYFNTALVNLDISDSPLLRRVDLKENDALTVLIMQNLPVLEMLEIKSSNLVNLDVSGLPLLKSLTLKENGGLTTLTLRNLLMLKYLSVVLNNTLSNVELSGLPLLKRVTIRYNDALAALTLRDLPVLEYLCLDQNRQLTQVTTSKNKVEQPFNYDHVINKDEQNEILVSLTPMVPKESISNY